MGGGKHSSAVADFYPQNLDALTILPTPLAEMESSRDDTRLHD